MDRIEDETVRLLFFLQIAQEPGEARRPQLGFNLDDEGFVDDGEEGDDEEASSAAAEQQRVAAQSTIQDFTRNIQRKKEKEMEQLQMVGGDGSNGASKQVVKGDKVGRNDPCPCGSGKKYKKCHGA